jgi:hypothetical protein
MPQCQPALTFVDNGGRHPTVPRSLQASIIAPLCFYHKPLYVKKLSFAAYAKVDQNVTVRYNLVVEPGLPVSPLQGGPAFHLPAPRSCAAIIDATPLGKRGKGPEFCWEAPAFSFAPPRCPKPSHARALQPRKTLFSRRCDATPVCGCVHKSLRVSCKGVPSSAVLAYRTGSKQILPLLAAEMPDLEADQHDTQNEEDYLQE